MGRTGGEDFLQMVKPEEADAAMEVVDDKTGYDDQEGNYEQGNKQQEGTSHIPDGFTIRCTFFLKDFLMKMLQFLHVCAELSIFLLKGLNGGFLPGNDLILLRDCSDLLGNGILQSGGAFEIIRVIKQNPY